MKLIDKILYYVTVPKCVGCGEKLCIDDKALCKTCYRKYLDILNKDCSSCAKNYNLCTCSNEYLTARGVKKLYKVFRYFPGERNVANNLIFALKKSNRKDVMEFLSDELAAAIIESGDNITNCIFTNVPRRRATIAQYGYDHAAEIAKRLAKNFSCEYSKLLTSNSKKSQKETSGEQRKANPDFEYINEEINLKGKQVIIVDDVVTTGASMAACTMLIRALGAKQVIGASLSIAYKDDVIRFDLSDRFNKK